MNVVRALRCLTLSQSVRAANSYSSRIDASPPAGSPPCGAPVTKRTRAASAPRRAPWLSGTRPDTTPDQNAPSLRPASRLSMLSGVPITAIRRSRVPSVVGPRFFSITLTRGLFAVAATIASW